MVESESHDYSSIQLMLDSAPFAAHFWDKDLNIIDCNQAAVKMFNLTSKQEYIRRYFELTPEFQPDGGRSYDRQKQLIDETFKTGYKKTEWMRRQLNGEPIPVEITLVRVDYRGQDLIASYSRDLREHRQMTDDIIKRDTLLDVINRIAVLLLAAANDGHFEDSLLKGMELIGKCLGVDFVQIWPNEMRGGALHFALQYKWLSEIGKQAPDIPIGTAVPYSERWKELFARGECVNGPLTALPKEDQDLLGPLGITSTVTVPLFYHDKFWGVFCVDDCVKERFFNESELNLLFSAGLMLVNAINRNRQAAETSLQLAKLNLVLKASKISLWEMEVDREDPVNPSNVFIWSNEFREMLGYRDENDFPNVLSSWSDRLHERDKEKTLAAFERHLTDKTGKTPYEIEYQLQRKSGEYTYYRASGLTIRDEEGNPIRVVGALLDITETQNLLNDLETEKEAALSANNAKTTFLANMSHEIRTPMNAILGMSEILGHEELTDRQVGYVDDIKFSAQALLGIINDILDMSKIEAGKLELNPVDFIFEQFADNIVSMFTHVAHNKGLEFIYETSGSIPECLLGDDIRLRQALTNICGNAVKFTEKGHVKLSVSTSDGRLVFKVEDTGSGIHKDDLPKLFNAFEQVDKNKNRDVVGTGLGLSICKSFIEMMGGDISVESEYGHGAAFTLTVPIVRGNADNIRNIETNKLVQTISAPDARILVTDDNGFNLKVASGLLGLMDIKAELADSGAKAIELVKRNEYDIVFMDHMMPEMDGVETVREIRSLGGKYGELLIIALTANAISGARAMFLENGFDDFISKPIDAGELQGIVQRYLPPEKVTATAPNENRLVVAEKETELRRKSIVTFVKENRDTYERIVNSLRDGDTKTAYRIAHTLKSSSGFLGKRDLQNAALSL
ncbi:MAG: ATP-binding protein, partial [Defluviitaleaceae bacterium]|nr:ATP-binding protein [Defluviitaleaceae bacterium]